MSYGGTGQSAGDSSSRIDLSDYIIVALIAVATLVWFTKGKYWAVPKQPSFSVPTTSRVSKTRDVVQKMKDSVSSLPVTKMHADLIE